MQWLLFATGVAVLAFTMLDVVWTTLSLSGAGPLTRLIAHGLWVSMVSLQGRGVSRWALSWVGVMILLVTLVCWLMLTWLAYLVMFSAFPEHITFSLTGEPVELFDRIYFVGMTISTLGTGDISAASTGYRLLMAMAALNGLFIATLAISYLVPMLSAVVAKRHAACQIAALGSTPQQMLLNAWTGEDFGELYEPLRDIASLIVMHAQRHLAYPVLHYFHSRTPRDSFPWQMVTLSEAVLLLRHGVAAEHRPDALTLRMVDQAIETYMQVVHGTYVRRRHAEEPPPPPSRQRLAEAGIVLTPPAELIQAVQQYAEPRRQMRDLLRSQNLKWELVMQADPHET